MTEQLKLDALPDILTNVDICRILRYDDPEQARGFVRKHRAQLQPFKVGRENRCYARNFVSLLESLQKVSNQ